MMTRAADSDEGLLRFLMPGVLHHLGNALFAIQGHSQSLGSETPDLEAEKAAILRGADQAHGAVRVLAHLSGETTGQPVQGGILMHRLCEIVRVPLREGGLRLHLQHSSPETPEPVDGTVFCRTMTATLQAVLAALPTGFRGELGIDLAFQSTKFLDIRMRVRGDADTLPFPIYLDEVVQALSPRLSEEDVEISRDDREHGLQLRIPTLSLPGPDAKL